MHDAAKHAPSTMHAANAMQDLDIAITPHLDDGLELGGWRNALVFDPMAKYGGYSYYEVGMPHSSRLLSSLSSQQYMFQLVQPGYLACQHACLPGMFHQHPCCAVRCRLC